jgi:hypothetical protein
MERQSEPQNDGQGNRRAPLVRTMGRIESRHIRDSSMPLHISFSLFHQKIHLLVSRPMHRHAT